MDQTAIGPFLSEGHVKQMTPIRSLDAHVKNARDAEQRCGQNARAAGRENRPSYLPRATSILKDELEFGMQRYYNITAQRCRAGSVFGTRECRHYNKMGLWLI